nr:C-type lectin domain family 4 member A-like [Pelodiscus sinensis]|eukprot:XP_025036709.1 C-type lectin domain family 4 member A-like [Pelodiscus sinensis]
MESEIIYTEVKFKNAPPPAAATAPPAKSTPPSAPQKHTHSLLWLVSALLLLLCLSLLAALIVTLLNPSCEKHRTLSQSSTEWHCVTGTAEGKGRIYMCCPVGWDSFQDSCYHFFNDSMTWGDSERNCTGMGSHLVVINTEAEQDFISDWIRRTATGSDKKDYYIGLTSQEREGQWHWVDKTLYKIPHSESLYTAPMSTGQYQGPVNKD